MEVLAASGSQTDGQIEQLKQTPDHCLRYFIIIYTKKDWVQLVLLALLVYQSTIGEASRFFAGCGFNLEAMREPKRFEKNARKVFIQVEQLQTLHEELERDIGFSIHRSELCITKKEIGEPILKKRG